MATKVFKFYASCTRNRTQLDLEHTCSFAAWANVEDLDFFDWHTPCATFVHTDGLMAIEVPFVAVGQPEEPALNEKSDAYAEVEHTSSSANPVIESAEFAFLVSVDLLSLFKLLKPFITFIGN
jgi:hypothetical protein